MKPVRQSVTIGALPHVPTYIGICCREWVLAENAALGSCGLCGQRPVFLRADS